MSRLRNTEPFFELSKFLSWILRHGAVKEEIPLKEDGFVQIEYILNHPNLKERYTKEDILQVVEADQKCRFAVRLNKHSFDIRANQGHSISNIRKLELSPITNANDFEFVIHGTFFNNWKKIKTEGLLRMGRNHIHFAQNVSNTCGVISGLRKNAEIYIYINLTEALKSGLKFFRSCNGVILSPGDHRGCIKPIYFLKVNRADGTLLKY